MIHRGQTLRRRAIAIAVACGALLLSACQVNLTTTVNVAENGSGTIVIVATADAEAVGAAPELLTALNVDDLETAGWTMDVQSPAANGGLTVTLQRPFATTDEATYFLSQLSGERGPLRNVVLTRTGDVNDAAYQLSAVAGLPDGLAGFADSQALVALGGAPFAAALTERGASITDVLSMSFQVTLPGEPVDSASSDAVNSAALTPREVDDPFSTFRWTLPVDQTEQTLLATTRDRDVSAMVASYAAKALFVLLILLVAIAVLYLATVAYRRSNSTPAS